MSIAESQKLLTAEEFSRLPNDGPPMELVRGRLVKMNQPKPRHGQVCMEIASIYGNAAKDNELGDVVTNDTGVITERDPDTVRGADVAFFSYSRVPKGPLPDEYLSVAPNVVFEVLSSDDRWSKVLRKVSEYLEGGVPVVCVADPKTETVHVYRPDQPAEELTGDAELVLPEFSAEFAVQVSSFFWIDSYAIDE